MVKYVCDKCGFFESADKLSVEEHERIPINEGDEFCLEGLIVKSSPLSYYIYRKTNHLSSDHRRLYNYDISWRTGSNPFMIIKREDLFGGISTPDGFLGEISEEIGSGLASFLSEEEFKIVVEKLKTNNPNYVIKEFRRDFPQEYLDKKVGD